MQIQWQLCMFEEEEEESNESKTDRHVAKFYGFHWWRMAIFSFSQHVFICKISELIKFHAMCGILCVVHNKFASPFDIDSFGCFDSAMYRLCDTIKCVGSHNVLHIISKKAGPFTDFKTKDKCMSVFYMTKSFENHVLCFFFVFFLSSYAASARYVAFSKSN